MCKYATRSQSVCCRETSVSMLQRVSVCYRGFQSSCWHFLWLMRWRPFWGSRCWPYPGELSVTWWIEFVEQLICQNIAKPDVTLKSIKLLLINSIVIWYLQNNTSWKPLISGSPGLNQSTNCRIIIMYFRWLQRKVGMDDELEEVELCSPLRKGGSTWWTQHSDWTEP